MQNFIAFHSTLIQSGVVLLSALGCSGIECYLYRRFQASFCGQGLWRRAFCVALHWPAQFFIWLVATHTLLSVLQSTLTVKHYPTHLIQLSYNLLILLCFFWFGMNVIRNAQDTLNHQIHTGQRQIQEATKISAIAQMIRLVLIAIVFLMGLQVFELKLSALLAFGGVMGAVIGFSAKDSLGNFLGGLMLYWDRPFLVGDWIRSPDRQIEGIVDQIGWRLTCIRTFNHHPLYIPNGVLNNIILENPGRMTHRRIKLMLSIKVRFKDVKKVQSLILRIQQMLGKHPNMDATQPLLVNLHSLNSTFNILIDGFTKTVERIQFNKIRQEILLEIFLVLTSFEAEHAFPIEIQDFKTVED